MQVEIKSPGAISLRNVTSVILATVLLLFVAFLYVFSQTTFFGQPSVYCTVRSVQTPR